ncbi:hypothetical protein [Dactylosporangium darangshiense]|uniref:4-hydroxyphenylpyruvate dioxygenase n=1 Tax=Dactylosporangium darangshiense TaxID=579108 RepID=A0ABP8DDU0_9ACTN
MRTSIATVSLSGTLEEKLAAAAQAGFDGVELFENDVVTSAARPAGIRRRIEDLGLRVELYQPLRHSASVEVADPYGLVRSRAAASPSGAVCLLLSVPALGGGRLPEAADYQHIAFACTDIFAAAVDLRVPHRPRRSHP